MTHGTWMGGTYQDPKQRHRHLPGRPRELSRRLSGAPDSGRPEEGLWLEDRRGAAVGRLLAERYGWKVGDVIPIRSNIYRKKDGGDTWDLDVSAIYDATEQGIDKASILLHYEYLQRVARLRQGHGGLVHRARRPIRSARPRSPRPSTSSSRTRPPRRRASTEKALRTELRAADRRHRRHRHRGAERCVLLHAAGDGDDHGAGRCASDTRARRC